MTILGLSISAIRPHKTVLLHGNKHRDSRSRNKPASVQMQGSKEAAYIIRLKIEDKAVHGICILFSIKCCLIAHELTIKWGSARS